MPQETVLVPQCYLSYRDVIRPEINKENIQAGDISPVTHLCKLTHIMSHSYEDVLLPSIKRTDCGVVHDHIIST